MAGMLSVLVPVIALGVVTACSSTEPGVPVEELLTPPDVVGETVDAARERLELDGFVVEILADEAPPPSPEVTETADLCPEGEVVNQDPPPEEEVRMATTVVLTATGC